MFVIFVLMKISCIRFKTTCLLFVIGIFGLSSCKNEIPTPTPNFLEGGKGGTFMIAIFTKSAGKNQSSRVYLKYAAESAPADTSLYDEKDNTMVEPGFGPHVHFNNLKTGTYFVHAATKTNLQADTVIQILNTDAQSRDLYINLK